MSRVIPHIINCPSCKAPVEAHIYESVNVTLEPPLKERVLNQTINRMKCQKCGHEANISTALLYHDMTKSLMIWFMQEGEQDVAFPMRNKVLRIVHSYAALVEKILIFDAGLDDCVVEVLKFALWSEATQKGPAEYRGEEIRFYSERDTELSFILFTPEGQEIIKFPKAAALSMSAMVVKTEFIVPSGRWCVVDRAYVLEKSKLALYFSLPGMQDLLVTPDIIREIVGKPCTLPMPEKRKELGFVATYTTPEADALRAALVSPESMDDKWSIYYLEGNVYFHRSWTGRCIYIIKLKDTQTGSEVIESWVNRDPTQYKETDLEYDQELLRWLIDRFILKTNKVGFPKRRGFFSKLWELMRPW